MFLTFSALSAIFVITLYAMGYPEDARASGKVIFGAIVGAAWVAFLVLADV